MSRVRAVGWAVMAALVLALWPGFVSSGERVRPMRFTRQAPRAPWTIKILESRSNGLGHNMDTEWEKVAKAAGHKAEIVPQTILDNPSSLSGTHIVVISSGLIDIPLRRQSTLETFMSKGGGIYLQSEYKPTYPGNQTFEYLVGRFGGRYKWTSEVQGDLAPVTVLGSLNVKPAPVGTLPYFWWGCEGSGRGVETFLTHNNHPLGFVFCPRRRSHGMLITTSDQDWVKDASIRHPGPVLMLNILHRLATASPCN